MEHFCCLLTLAAGRHKESSILIIYGWYENIYHYKQPAVTLAQIWPSLKAQHFINMITVKLLKFGHPINCCNYPKIWIMWLYCHASKICRQNCKQCTPWSDCLAVWSKYALFTKTCQSKNLGSLRCKPQLMALLPSTDYELRCIMMVSCEKYR